ncbi:hypothetical protein [Pedobacter sp. V48]|uniref:hypothetical protein n=1 Tax=Pedobacter sp. V48 TaxID=509635 RepID=UPI0003E4BC0F|nr:hypothetical protein [Pedobacter sp. V48]ETZ22401.1 hypothetical protein N824_01770 [Pedobacter sp. V48]
MEANYEISLNIRTSAGMETYGCFSLGADEKFASRLYSSLEGDEQIAIDSVITIDLIKRENGIPLPQGLLHCSYDQLAANVRLITKEVFKKLNLKLVA